jgi:hypothetical protein
MGRLWACRGFEGTRIVGTSPSASFGDTLVLLYETAFSLWMMTTIGEDDRSGGAAGCFVDQFTTRNATAAPAMPTAVTHCFQVQIRGRRITQLGAFLARRARTRVALPTKCGGSPGR